MSFALKTLRKLRNIFNNRKKTRKKIYRFERLKSELERRIRIKTKILRKRRKTKISKIRPSNKKKSKRNPHPPLYPHPSSKTSRIRQPKITKRKPHPSSKKIKTSKIKPSKIKPKKSKITNKSKLKASSLGLPLQKPDNSFKKAFI